MNNNFKKEVRQELETLCENLWDKNIIYKTETAIYALIKKYRPEEVTAWDTHFNQALQQWSENMGLTPPNHKENMRDI